MSTPWTEESIKALGVRTDLRTALEICGIGRTAGYQLAAKGELPFPVLRIGKQYVVPVRGLLEALGIPAEEAMA